MFRKRESVDILDIPELHRKKLIRLPEKEEPENIKVSKDGYFDLSQNSQNHSQINSSVQQIQVEDNQEVKQETSQVTSFLSDFASIGSINSTNQTGQETKIKENTDKSDIKDLKWRLENLEFKLEQLIEKFNSSNK